MVVLTQTCWAPVPGLHKSPRPVCDKPRPESSLPAARVEHTSCCRLGIDRALSSKKTYGEWKRGGEGLSLVLAPERNTLCLARRFSSESQKSQPHFPARAAWSKQRNARERSPLRFSLGLTVVTDDRDEQTQEKDRAGPSQRRPDVSITSDVKPRRVYGRQRRHQHLGGPGSSTPPHPTPTARASLPAPGLGFPTIRTALGSTSRIRGGLGRALPAVCIAPGLSPPSGPCSRLTCFPCRWPARLRAWGHWLRCVGGRRRGSWRRRRLDGLRCGTNRAWLGGGLRIWPLTLPTAPRASALRAPSSRCSTGG